MEDINKKSTVKGTYSEMPMHRRWAWWENLSAIADSSAIRRFNAFLIIVPFFVGFLNFIPNIDIIMPTSWVFGYIAAVFFLIGTVLVGIWCPEIAKPYKTYQTIKDEGRTIQYILQESREIYLRYKKSPERANYFLYGLLGSPIYVDNSEKLIPELPEESDSELKDRTTIWSLVDKAQFNESNLNESFWYIKWFASATNQTKRFICWILFGLGGLSAILFLLAQINIIIRHYVTRL